MDWRSLGIRRIWFEDEDEDGRLMAVYEFLKYLNNNTGDPARFPKTSMRCARVWSGTRLVEQINRLIHELFSLYPKANLGSQQVP